MRYLAPAIEQLLDETSSRWRWLRFLQHTATLASIVTGLVLLLGVGMVLGWFTSPAWTAAGFVLLMLASVFAWMLMGVGTAFALENRPWLAASLERAHRPLMDRLNTLVFLQRTRDQRLQAYADRIEQQTREVLSRRPPPSPFSPARVLAHFGVFAGVLTATVLFYTCFHPWRHVRAAAENAALVPQKEPLLEIPPLEEPAEQPPEEEEPAPWGEIRISEPGCDLRATLLDVVPLRIEAAASRPLRKVEWFTAVNSGAESPHELPPPEDPRYVVYQPELHLRDYALKEWDVLSYFARATTEDGQSYQSDVYFVEVFPFREELDELPGGPEGRGYTLLEQLTGMIERQQEVIRQTDWEERLADRPAADRREHVRALAGEEADLQRTARHVAAAAAGRLEQSASDELDDRLRRTESTLGEAENSLREDDLKEAGRHEQAALAELVANRKQLQQLLRWNPEVFETPPQDPAAADQMEAAREQTQSARQFVRQALSKQRNLEQRADPKKLETFPELAQEQRRLNRSLEEFVRENPQSFRRSRGECSAAQSAMGRAAESMEAGNSEARQRAAAAADELQKLDDSLKQQQQRNGLADAYELKRMLDEQVSRLGQCRRQGATPGQCQQLAGQARSVTDQLKQIAEQEPTSGCFGPQLGQALSDENKRQLDAQSDRLAQAADPAEQKAASGELQEGLEKVSRAFDASCPGMMAGGRGAAPLEATGQEAVARGLRHLDSAARRQASGRPLPAEANRKLQQEAIANLLSGIEDLGADDEQSSNTLRSLRESYGPGATVDQRVIRRLIEQIRNLSVELVEAPSQEVDEPELRYIDPATLPPAYREPIRKYFQKLSERR